ncbi:sigma-70 family RNA polymerase sigma factor [Nitrospirillum pindoramense]|uniref:RNA polymerase sigma factor n=1 Tax=Nitrospirillum amazonense TaxID=28077 RepID=A0A560GYG3_9PROT|nr:sigma-70 family RNA polymerase sigma factor [Nitrospirillum amazonense]TWB39073.1 RNA polymerase sigma-70 factor (ECF subfamily) [Nitrospirillum amazonense]
MSVEPYLGFHGDVLELLPSLRAFAKSLARNDADTEDLVQETVVRAWAHAGQFHPGSCLRAWLFTILRNHFYAMVKQRRREQGDPDGAYYAQLAVEPRQEWRIRGREVAAALARLPVEQRQALLLVGAGGASYEEAADRCGCAVGTVKSRVNRARSRLMKLNDPMPASIFKRPAPTAFVA